MPLPPAVLNYEEMHWQTTSVSLNQRHWLNHRNSVTNTAERDPPPPRIVAYLATKKHLHLVTKKHKKHKKKDCCSEISSRALCAFLWLNFLWLAQAEFAGAALFEFQITTNFEQAIEHFRTLCAACGELRVGLFVHVLEAMKFVGDV